MNRGRELAERLFAAGKVKRPTLGGDPIHYRPKFRHRANGTGAWCREDSYEFRLDWEVDDLAAMAIIRAIREKDCTVRTPPIPSWSWWARPHPAGDDVSADASTDLEALALLACRVFNIPTEE